MVLESHEKTHDLVDLGDRSMFIAIDSSRHVFRLQRMTAFKLAIDL